MDIDPLNNQKEKEGLKIDRRMLVIVGIIIISILAYLFFLSDKPLILQIIDML